MVFPSHFDEVVEIDVMFGFISGALLPTDVFTELTAMLTILVRNEVRLPSYVLF